MDCLKYLLLIAITASPTTAVQVNLHGSVSLGKQVFDTITYHLLKNYVNKGNRRLMGDNNPPTYEAINNMVNSASLCKGLTICDNKYSFLNKYIIGLAVALEAIFSGILNGHEDDAKSVLHAAVFQDKLQFLLQDFKELLLSANAKETYYVTETVTWISIVKKISADFQRMSLSFILERLKGDPKETKDVKKKLSQKLVLAIITIENRFTRKLCTQYSLCEKNMTCTDALHHLLSSFKTAPDGKARSFMKHFDESLPEGTFYFLNDETTNEFQVILSDMIYSETVPTKNILLTVLKAVDSRKDIVNSKQDLKEKLPYDVSLIHVILSDLDFLFTGESNFQKFLNHFDKWVHSDGNLSVEMRQVIKDIETRLSKLPPELKLKLINQVQAFMELTVDPS